MIALKPLTLVLRRFLFPRDIAFSAGLVAQRLEQVTHNLRVAGPNPAGTTSILS